MNKSTAKAVKEPKTNGFAFFSLLNEDDIIEYQGSRRKFVAGDCGEDIPDPDTMTDYLEVYPSKKEEEIEDLLTPSVDNWQFVDFSEIECGCCGGRICVAIIDAKNGVIVLERSEEIIPSDFVIVDEDYSFATKVYPKRIRGTREYAFNPWNEPDEKRGWRKPHRNNRKTMPDNKVQRDNRALLGQVKVRCVEEVDFYEFAALMNYDVLNSFSPEDFYEEELEEMSA